VNGPGTVACAAVMVFGNFSGEAFARRGVCGGGRAAAAGNNQG
jgi:hypothetical protein